MSATGANSPKLTYDQFKALKKRREIAYPIVTDDEALVAYRQAAKAVEDAPARTTAADRNRLVKARDDAEKALREATIVVRLRALPKDEYKALRAEHPPTDEDHNTLSESTNGALTKAQFHADTFGPALVAACLVEPQVTVEQATEMAAEMNEAEWSGLFSAAINVNQTATSVEGLVFN
jgi:hypothetical protein